MVESEVVLELADLVFDHGVAAVLGLQFQDGAGPVGDEGVIVVKTGQLELALGLLLLISAHDEPGGHRLSLAMVGVGESQIVGFRHLGAPALGPGDGAPGRFRDLC